MRNKQNLQKGLPKKVGVIGLGKIGLPLLVTLSKHFKVVGVDIKKLIPIPHDEELRKTLNKYKHRIKISNDFKSLSDCEVVFCIVPTPSLKSGKFTNKYIKSAIKSAKPYLKNCKAFVINSTVIPGSCKKLQKLIDVPIVYNPMFIALNTVFRDIQNPDFVLIGDENNSGDIVYNIQRKITNKPIKRMSLKEAEIAKIGLNAYITMKISFANSLGVIAQKHIVDGEKILDAIGTDSRIGNKYFKPGGAYGGPCFPRDNKAFSTITNGVPNYSKLTDNINKYIARKIGHHSDDKRYQNV